MNRRKFLSSASLFCAAAALVPGHLFASTERAISLDFVHTGDGVRNLVYWRDGRYVPEAMNRLSEVLADHRSGEKHPIDPGVIDILHDVRLLLETTRPIQACSGYRSPLSNEYLRTTGSGGVSKKSLHMEGRACDFSIPGVPLETTWMAIKSLGVGGAGIYSTGFCHADNGAVKSWRG